MSSAVWHLNGLYKILDCDVIDFCGLFVSLCQMKLISIYCGDCLLAFLTHCILGNFSCFLSSADFFFQNYFFEEKKSFSNTIRISNSFDPDQARRFVGPDQGLNCLQRLSADDTGRQRVNSYDLQIVSEILVVPRKLHFAVFRAALLIVQTRFPNSARG